MKKKYQKRVLMGNATLQGLGMHIWLIKLIFQEIQGNDKYRNQSSGYLRGEEGVVIEKKDVKVLLGWPAKVYFGPAWC